MRSCTDFTIRALLQNYYAAVCDSQYDPSESALPMFVDVVDELARELYKFAFSDELENMFFNQ